MHILDTHFRLRAYVNERRTFEARFFRYGGFKSPQGQTIFTICLQRVRDTKSRPIMAQHIWLRSNRDWDMMHLERGDIVYFEATVRQQDSGKIDLIDTVPLYVRDGQVS